MLLFYGRKINASLAPQPCHKTPLQRLRQDIEPRRGKVTLKDIKPVENSGEQVCKVLFLLCTVLLLPFDLLFTAKRRSKAFLYFWLAFRSQCKNTFFYAVELLWCHSREYA